MIQCIELNQQEALILSAGSNVKDGANSIALETVTAYVDILRKKELFDIAKDSMEVHKKYLAQIKEKVDAGVCEEVQTTNRRSQDMKTLRVFIFLQSKTIIMP